MGPRGRRAAPRRLHGSTVKHHQPLFLGGYEADILFQLRMRSSTLAQFRSVRINLHLRRSFVRSFVRRLCDRAGSYSTSFIIVVKISSLSFPASLSLLLSPFPPAFLSSIRGDSLATCSSVGRSVGRSFLSGTREDVQCFHMRSFPLG